MSKEHGILAIPAALQLKTPPKPLLPTHLAGESLPSQYLKIFGASLNGMSSVPARLMIGWVGRKTEPKRLAPKRVVRQARGKCRAKGQETPKPANELQGTPKRENSSRYCCDFAVSHDGRRCERG